MRRRCQNCNRITTNIGPRCSECEQHWQQQRNANPNRDQYKTVEYKAIRFTPDALCWKCGRVCVDMVKDHIKTIDGQVITILPACRRCNSNWRTSIVDIVEIGGII